MTAEFFVGAILSHRRVGSSPVSYTHLLLRSPSYDQTTTALSEKQLMSNDDLHRGSDDEARARPSDTPNADIHAPNSVSYTHLPSRSSETSS